MGVILLVGSIGLLDLRLLGYARAVALDDLARALTPLALAGFAIAVASGTILFAADAAALAVSAVFRLKLLLLVAAGANALAFRWLSALPLARGLALLSLVLWLAIVIAGRMIAYL
ncbi:hypothetical protein [Brevundimonas sp. R86498]|uniref:hypothetical protein n=1 Tax=Brevundimonas sp. R86498 TaxID=3093845 RepID=UPI0037C917A5